MRWAAAGTSSTTLLTFSLIGTLLPKAQAQTGLPTLTATTDNAIPTAEPSSAASSQESKGSASATGNSATTSADSNLPTLGSSDDSAAASSTDSGAAASSKDAPPPLTTSTAAIPHLTGLPTIAGAFSYPAPTVPPTANAPYMQRSTLPEGTVFICVGAALAFIALVMIVWRVLVAWSINHSVKKSALTTYTHDTKSMLHPRKKSGLYSMTAGSNLSLEKLAATGRRHSGAAKGQPPNSSLFFSPTAGAGMHSMANRNSGYLPAGYYSTGNAAAGNGMPTTQIGNPNSRPHSSGYNQNFSSAHYDASPDMSPSLPPSRSNLATQESMSSLNVSVATGNRAPSTFLDDLMSIPPLPPPNVNSRTSTDRPRR